MRLKIEGKISSFCDIQKQLDKWLEARTDFPSEIEMTDMQSRDYDGLLLKTIRGGTFTPFNVPIFKEVTFNGIPIKVAA